MSSALHGPLPRSNRHQPSRPNYTGSSTLAGGEFGQEAGVGGEIESRVALADLTRVDHCLAVEIDVKAELLRGGRAAGIGERLAHGLDRHAEGLQFTAKLR